MSEELQNMQMDMLFRPPEEQMLPEVIERQALVLPYIINSGLRVDSFFLTANCYQVAREWFESPELQSCVLRFAVSSARC